MPKIRELLTRWSFKGDTGKLGRFNRMIAATKGVARTSAKALGGMALAGAGAAAGLLSMVKAEAEAADQIAKDAKRLDVAPETLQRLALAAEYSGTNIQKLIPGLKKLSKTAYDASEGSKMAKDAFAKLGINVKDHQGEFKDTETLMWEVFTALSAVENSTLKVALAQSVLGKSGVEVLPLLGEGEQGLAKMMRRANELGGVLSGEALAGAEGFMDALLELKTGFRGVRIELAARFYPILTKYMKKAAEWLVANRKLVQQKLDSYIRRISKWIQDINWKEVISGAKAAAKVFWAIAKAVGAIVLDADALKTALYSLGAVAVISALGNLVMALVAIGKGAAVAGPALKTMLLFAGPLGIALMAVATAAAMALSSYKDLVKARAEFLLQEHTLAGLNAEGEGGAEFVGYDPPQKWVEAPAFLRKASAGPAFLQPREGSGGRGEGSNTANMGGMVQNNHFHGPVDRAAARTIQQQTARQLNQANRALLEGIKR